MQKDNKQTKQTRESSIKKKGGSKKEEVTGCQDCVNRVNVKANLNCGHTCCENCIMKFSIFCCLSYKPYEHSAYCASCNALRKISIINPK